MPTQDDCRTLFDKADCIPNTTADLLIETNIDGTKTII